jgi:hypothetical protein
LHREIRWSGSDIEPLLGERMSATFQRHQLALDDWLGDQRLQSGLLRETGGHGKK